MSADPHLGPGIELAAAVRYTGTRPQARGAGQLRGKPIRQRKHAKAVRKWVMEQGFTDVIDFRHGGQDHLGDLQYPT